MSIPGPLNKAKRPPGRAPPEKASELSYAPSIVPEVGCRALIAPVSYVQWLAGCRRGLSIHHWTRGCQALAP